MTLIRTSLLALFTLIAIGLGLPIVSAQLDSGSEESGFEEDDMPYFPEVAGRNINEQPYTLPNDLEGEYNLLLLAFDQRHQSAVNTWLGSMRGLEAEFSNLRVYEVPTLPAFAQWQQRQIDNWMSAGISDPLARETTITLYTDVDAMKAALNIRNTSRVRLFLVDRSGNIYWQGEGSYSEEQFQELSDVVHSLES